MKKLLFILSAAMMLLTTSCAVKLEAPHRYIYTFDYTEVTRTTGVGFTESDAVSFDYIALGTLCIQEYGGYVKNKEQVNTKQAQKYEEKDGIYYKADVTNYKSLKYAAPDPYKGLEAMANAAIGMGGDYILNLRISYREAIGKHGEATQYYELAGMVVKRK